MNEYMCRAKRIKDQKWICGYFIDVTGDATYLAVPDGNRGSWTIHAVNFKTVCRCTGKKDKNGNFIFERDIVKDHNQDIGEVHWWSGRYVGFGISIWTRGKDMVVSERLDNCEVIGNSFDNFDILKEIWQEECKQARIRRGELDEQTYLQRQNKRH